MNDHLASLLRTQRLMAPTSGRPDLEGPGKDAIVDVSKLTALSGSEFVSATFRDVLGREAEPAAIEHHLALLARGADKIALIRSLHETPEGKAFGAQLVGAWPTGRFNRYYKLPVIGRLIRLIVSLLRVPRLQGYSQNLNDQLVLIQHRNKMLERQNAADFAELRQQVDEQRTLIHSLLRRLADTAAREQIVGVRRQLDSIAREHGQLRASVDVIKTELDKEAWAEPLLSLASRVEKLDTLFDEAQRLDAAIDILAQAFRTLSPQDGAPKQDRATLVARSAEIFSDQAHRIRAAERATETVAASLQDQERRLSLLLETVRRRSEPLDAAQAATVAEQQDHLLDPLYVAFEERFRGSRALIKERQRAHLGVMRDAGAGAVDRPIIDVGAGRGEWLELLHDEGLTAQGIDLNETMVEECRTRGLDCALGDAVEALSRMPSGSAGAVTGFHIIEHLPFRTMVALLDEALRVLAPGGVVLFETPNPANLLVSSRYFYLDPTHQNPLPGEMVAMITEARGFAQVRIEPLHPMTESFLAADDRLGQQLDALFYGPQDYALIAHKA